MKIYAFAGLFAVFCAHAALRERSHDEFIQTYLIDYQRPVAKLVIDCACARQAVVGHPCCLPELPDYFIKDSIDRIKRADTAYRLLHNYQLNALMIPQKFLYHRPGQPWDLRDDNFWVVAERVWSAHQVVRLTEPQTRDLAHFIRLTELTDVHTENCLCTDDGRIALIDLGEPEGILDEKIPGYLGILNLTREFDFDGDAAHALVALIDAWYGVDYFYKDYSNFVTRQRAQGIQDTVFITTIQAYIQKK